MSDEEPRDTPLDTLARAIAQTRRSSVAILEITRVGDLLTCQDTAALMENDGREAVLNAMVVALRVMLDNAELALAYHYAKQDAEPAVES